MPKNVGQLGAGQSGQGRAVTFRESDLKICELCGWLNLESNEECFVCGWHGQFERDPRVVHAALELALRQHGRLELEYVTDVVTYNEVSPVGIMQRCAAWIRSLFTRFRRTG